ncbi:MAG: hypothetical protein AAGE65_13545 [Planctomycetota bacterium]
MAVPDVALSTASPASLGSVNFENDSLVGYDPATDVAVELFNLDDSFGIERNLDAAYELPNGNLVVSTQAGDTIGSLAFTESDLIELDRTNGTVAMFLDASAIGLVGNNNTVANIDAVHVLASGEVLFSVGSLSGATLLGTSYDNADVVAYDPATNTASLFLDGSVIVGDDPDLHAFAVIDAQHVLLAAFNSGGTDAMTLGGLTFSRDDLVLYNPMNDTATLFLEGLNEFSAPGEIIDAVTPAVVPEPGTLVWALALPALLVRRCCLTRR